MWAIIITASGSLHAHNITDIQTADQAAKALEPLVRTFPNAGEIAKTIFALGIIGTGLIAIPDGWLISIARLQEDIFWHEYLTTVPSGYGYCGSCNKRNRRLRDSRQHLANDSLADES